MNITADTNVLVRVIMRDDEAQARKALHALEGAERIAVAVPTWCELVWVLRGVYQLPRADIAGAVQALLAVANLVTHRPAVDAGLAMLEAGGDFADGAIAHEGHALGGDVFVSFDAQAVKKLKAQGRAAQCLGA